MNARLLGTPHRPASPPSREAPLPPEDLRALGRRLPAASEAEFRSLSDQVLALLSQPATQSHYDAAIMLDVEDAFENRFGEIAGDAADFEFAWGTREQAFAEWAARTCERWGRVAADYATHEISAFRAGSPLGLRLLATSLARLGDAALWRSIAGRAGHDLAPLHATYMFAEQKGLAGKPTMAVADGVSITATPEALYVRALLVDALCAGHFGRRECRQVSRWLLAWSGAARVCHVPCGNAASVVIDAGGGTGLHLGAYFARPAASYLGGLEHLGDYIADARSRAEQEFLSAFDGATPSERDAALGRLAVLLEYWTGRARQRAPREAPRLDTVVPVAVGFSEIERAIDAAAKVAGASRGSRLSLAASRASGTGDRDRHVPWGAEFAAGRMARVLDVSDSGVGLAFERVEEPAPSPGEVVGLQLDGRFHLGAVVRRHLEPARRRTFVGVRFLSKDANRDTVRVLKENGVGLVP